MHRRIQINGENIGDGSPVYVIAEVGINHNGDLKIAEKLIRAAASAGANAVKFQTYITKKRVPESSPIYGILKKCELSYKIQTDLKNFADAEGVTFFSTPFDIESVDFLAGLDVPAYKIASFEIVNLALVRHIASVGKPVIASRGMANCKEIDNAIQIMDAKLTPHALLHCVSAYPTALENASLKVIRSLLKAYECPVGYSDHTLGIKAPVFSVAVGAQIIEKHFTLDKRMEGPDQSMSANPLEMSEIVRNCREVESLLGDGKICRSEAEAKFTWLRRPSE
ncbi:MAG: N-acetylneuraminate synthase family protein [Deltaproteobacteria bacterium]|nr:N-acetylneuraminate synthase family protein [Deltaproteobacteria bacterium]MBW2342993.1 N-acetylneuraminate synthase family protein [Deltaproteobacteria bacterium]